MLPNTQAASDLPQTLNSGSLCAYLVPNRHILIQSSQPPHEKGTNSIYTSSIRTGLREGRPPAQCRTARKRLQHRVNHSIIPKLLPAPKTLRNSRNFTAASHAARQTCSTCSSPSHLWPGITKGCKLNSGTAQQLKAFAGSLDEQFDPQSPHGGKRETSPSSRPLPSTCSALHTHAPSR